jgi:hypothetical protein
MNSINYAIEYLVAGAAFMLSLLLLTMSTFGPWYYELDLLKTLTQDEGRVVALLVFLFPFVYWFGIVLDRFADDFTEKAFARQIKNELLKDLDAEYDIDCQKAFTKTRSYIYYHAPHLANIFEQNRVKLRVCRNSFVNAVLLTASSLILVLSPKFNSVLGENVNIDSATLIAVLVLVLAVGAFFTYVTYRAFRGLVTSECKWLLHQYYIVKSDKQIRA